jgi:hypothetical protein
MANIDQNQFFSLSAGNYYSIIPSFTAIGGITNVYAVNIPEGMSLNNTTGAIYGTPVNQGKSFIYYNVSDSINTASTILNFTIFFSNTAKTNIQVSPQNGYANITNFQFTSYVPASLSAYAYLWNFGDGNTSNVPNPTHFYNLPGTYNVTFDAYTPTGVKTLALSVKTDLKLNESLYFEYVPPPTFAGHYNRYPFRINFTSSVKGPHIIDLGAQYSKSYEAQIPSNKWSFLRPEWRFLDLNGNVVNNIYPTNEVEIYCDSQGNLNYTGNGYFVGVSGSYQFYFVDDLYNVDQAITSQPYTTIIATLRTSGIRAFSDSNNLDKNIPGFSNSLASAAIPYIFYWRSPDNLRISENGARDYVNPRWPQAVQNMVITANYKNPIPDPWPDGNGISLFNPDGAFARYIPTNNTDVLKLNVTTQGFSANILPQPITFQGVDNTGFKTAGYYKGKFTTNTVSALNATISASLTYHVPTLTAQFFNPILWISNPANTSMTIAQYFYNPALSAAINSPNLNVAHVYNFQVPFITNDLVALTGSQLIKSVAPLPAPSYHAWAVDSELNYIYRISSFGKILCALDLSNEIQKFNLVSEPITSFGILSGNDIRIDGNQNFYVSLNHSLSVLKFNNVGHMIGAFTPTKFLPQTNPPSQYYPENVAPYIDIDNQNNLWVTYNNSVTSAIVKYDQKGRKLFSTVPPLNPKNIIVDSNNNIWIAYLGSNSNYTLEKRDQYGNIIKSYYPIKNLKYINLDYKQNPWFTFSYSWVGTIDTSTGSVFLLNLSGTNQKFTNLGSWTDVNQNLNTTALGGIGGDQKGRVFVINSLEDNMYVIDSNSKNILNKFHLNSNSSAIADGDWTCLNWLNKFASKYTSYYIPNSSYVTLNGISKPLNFLQHQSYDIFKKNENFDIVTQMKSLAFVPSLRDSNVLFDEFFGSILGKYPFNHTDLGLESYEKIANFVSNHKDVDYCNIDQLYDLAASIGLSIEDFRLDYPEAIERIVDYASVNQSRLLGARSLDQVAFKTPNSQGILNRKYKPITSLCYEVSAGQNLVLKDKIQNVYTFVPTDKIYNIIIYPLQALANYINLPQDWYNTYEFYEFVPGYDYSEISGIIDWENPNTTINRNLSGVNNWFGSEGFLDAQLSYALYKGLGYINN